MRVGIVGTRPFGPPADALEYNDLISALTREIKALDRGVTIVSGGADGIDTYAVNLAAQLRHPTKVWPADWAGLGKRAGYVRNKQIVADSDRILAFPSSWSTGTWHTIELAYEDKKSCRVFWWDEAEGVLELSQSQVQDRLAKVKASKR